MKMKIFISWSGEKSKAAAKALRSLIPDLIPGVEPWMSEFDINAGARWNQEVTSELEKAKFGIICLTRTNLNAPWILFEAGALAKTLKGTFVCPYLIDLNPSDIPAGPLTQFQAKKATRDETQELIFTINKAQNEPLPKSRIERFFDTWWNSLWAEMQKLPEEQIVVTVDQKVQEILNLVRELSHRTSAEKRASSDADVIKQALIDPDTTD